MSVWKSRPYPRKLIICFKGIALITRWGHEIKSVKEMTTQEMLPNSPKETHLTVERYLDANKI